MFLSTDGLTARLHPENSVPSQEGHTSRGRQQHANSNTVFVRLDRTSLLDLTISSVTALVTLILLMSQGLHA